MLAKSVFEWMCGHTNVEFLVLVVGFRHLGLVDNIWCKAIT